MEFFYLEPVGSTLRRPMTRALKTTCVPHVIRPRGFVWGAQVVFKRSAGVRFYHRVSQGVPFYHSSVVEKLLTVGLYHRPRPLPGMTRFGGAPGGAGSQMPQTAEKG